jgi:hypothetical protein
MKQNAPYGVVALVLGICSIVFSCFFVGFVCGIVGLVLANKGLTEYNANPEAYNGDGALKGGKVTSIIGLVFGGIYILYNIIWVAMLGSAGLFF